MPDLNDDIDEIIYLIDNMPPVKNLDISNDTKYFENTYAELLGPMGTRGKIVISDHYLKFFDYSDRFVFNGQLLLPFASEFAAKVLNWDVVPQFEVTKSFSFMSNKSRPHRELSATIIANLFNENFAYTYNADNHNNKLISDELLHNLPHSINSSLTLPRQWVSGPNHQDHNGVAYSHATHFAEKLFSPLFKNAAVSLITEPNFFEKGFILTEKTLMSMYSGHFPIWIGGYMAADIASKFGIDVFDDIIDHSYQHIAHPGDRVLQAFLRNKKLLDDIPLLNSLRKKNINRLNANLLLFRDLDKLRSAVIKINDPILLAKSGITI